MTGLALRLADVLTLDAPVAGVKEIPMFQWMKENGGIAEWLALLGVTGRWLWKRRGLIGAALVAAVVALHRRQDNIRRYVTGMAFGMFIMLELATFKLRDPGFELTAAIDHQSEADDEQKLEERVGASRRVPSGG